MAATTRREFCVDTFCVWQIVAVATCRNGSVGVGVASDTGNITVLGFGCHQQVKCDVVTSGTQHILSGVRVVKHQRLVDFMADSTVSLGHCLRVRFVTGGTRWDVTVSIGVTEVTGYVSVLAWVGDQLIVLVGMACQTFCLKVTLQNDA